MISLLIIPILWIAISAGRAACGLVRMPQNATALERQLAACGIGLGMLAYGVLAVGLCGALNVSAICGVLIMLALVGALQHTAMARELIAGARALSSPSKFPALSLGIFILSAALAAIALVGCFTPPTLGIGNTGYTEWDSLSYHLADPKIYLQQHRIGFIPWESHSNFAFTAEMWYTIGLAFHSVPLAKLFHFTCGLGTCLATYAIGKRHFGPSVGVVAALLLAGSAPVLSEAGTAYVDLAATFFTALTLMCLLNGLKENECRWMMPLSAILMGFALSCKALALTSLAMFAGALLLWLIVRQKRSVVMAIAKTAGWCVLALVIGCVWYVKSYIYTGDPVFPFGYRIFHSPFWNAADAANYSAANYAFGVGHKPIDLLLAPWNLTMYPLPGHPTGAYPYLVGTVARAQSFNDYATAMMAVPAIFIAAIVALPFLRGPKVIGVLAAYAGLSFIFWFGSTQYVRYLLPLFPVLALLSAWSIVALVEAKRFSGYALAALAVFSVGFTLVNGFDLAKSELPVATGQQSQTDFLTQTDPAVYGAMTYINTSLPPGATIVFYGQPRGFYSDRKYFWGEAGHSTYVPYSQFHSAADLQNWFKQNNVGYILVNMGGGAFNMRQGEKDYPGWVYALTVGAGPPMYNYDGIGIWPVPANPVSTQ